MKRERERIVGGGVTCLNDPKENRIEREFFNSQISIHSLSAAATLGEREREEGEEEEEKRVWW